jgi:hypothetical protein
VPFVACGRIAIVRAVGKCATLASCELPRAARSQCVETDATPSLGFALSGGHPLFYQHAW